MINFRIRKLLARIALPILTVWLCILPSRSYAVTGLVAPFLIRLAGATPRLAYAAEGSVWLHASVAAITFDTSSATSSSASPTQAGSGALTVNINPKTAVPTPAGWTAPAAGQTQPTPPSTKGSPVANEPTDQEIQKECAKTFSFTGSLGGVPEATSIFAYRYRGQFWCQQFYTYNSNPNCPNRECASAYFTVLPSSIPTTYSCSTGYVVSGSTCVINPASPPPKPADNYCPIIPVPDGTSFGPDATDPDCIAIANGAGSNVQVGAAKVKASDRSVTIIRDDGTQTTYQTLATGGSQVQTLSYNASTDTTAYTTIEFSSPNLTTGEVTIEGFASSSVPGGGSLQGSSPGGVGAVGTGGSLTSGGLTAASGSGTGGATFPSDYARHGEATAAAQGIKDSLGTLHGDLTGTSNQGDPVEPTSGDMPGWGNTFSGLLGWQLPAHGGSCPTPSLDLSNLGLGVHLFSAHCTLINNHFNALNAAMMVVWTVLSLFVVLRA